MVTITFGQPDVSKQPSTSISENYSSGATITVKNTSGFSANDYLLLGSYGAEQTEIKAVSSITSATVLNIGTSSVFSHSTDTIVGRTLYNQARIYRSTTGLGGTYSLLSTIDLQPSELFNTYIDPNGVSPYSYKVCYYNSFLNAESGFSAEMPYNGYSFYSVKTIQDRVLTLFGDKQEQFITHTDILDWINECGARVQNQLTGGESPYYVTSSIITSTFADSYDISGLGVIHLFKIDLSYDGGLTYPDLLDVTDSRLNSQGGTAAYSASIMGNNLITKPKLPTGYKMRLWYYTDQTQLTSISDVLPDPLKGASDMYVDYCLMRAHEKDRKVEEMSKLYYLKWDKAMKEVVPRIKTRIKVANMMMSTPYADDYDVY